MRPATEADDAESKSPPWSAAETAAPCTKLGCRFSAACEPVDATANQK
jgi:hypothetical protein